MKLHSFFILFLIIIVSSCTVEKRHYQNGYHISFKKSTKKIDPTTVVKSSEELPNLKVISLSDNKSSKNDAIASNDIKSIALLYKKASHIIKLPSDSCDVMFLKNGKVLKINAIEINDNEIKYKKNDHLDGPVYVIKKNEVKKIVYKNGFVEEFSSNIKPENTTDKKELTKNSSKNVYDTSSIISFICGLLGFFLFFPAIIALIFGIKSLRKIKDSNDTLKGKAFAIIGIVFGGLIVAMLALILLLLLLIFVIEF